jgi:hypothetical protein
VRAAGSKGFEGARCLAALPVIDDTPANGKLLEARLAPEYVDVLRPFR